MIEIVHLTKYYGKEKALDGVSLNFPHGEIIVIVGPSGCGKTSLLRLVAGLEIPDDGKIVIEGTLAGSPVFSLAPHRRGLSLIFQDLALWPHMTVSGHIEFVLQKKKLQKDLLRGAIDKALGEVSLSGYDNRYPHELSGGEQQRLAIARAIVTRPKYLLMDEPFSNLDSILKEDLLNLTISLKKKTNMGVICVTHNIDEAYVLADQVAIMNDGHVVQFDSKERVFAKPENDFVRNLLKLRR